MPRAPGVDRCRLPHQGQVALLRSAWHNKDPASATRVPGAGTTRILRLWKGSSCLSRMIAMTRSVTSADGTKIAFDSYGEGGPVILIGGAHNDRSNLTGVAHAIAADRLAVAYDRRGRGASTNEDTEFAVERELEDLGALIEVLSGAAGLFGHSSGGILAIEAAMRGMPIEQLVVYEPPYMVEGTRPLPPAELFPRLCALVREDRRDEVVVAFYTEAVGLRSEVVEEMRAAPVWDRMTALAHTLPYDAAIPGDYRVPSDRLAALSVPTLVIDGSQSPAWMRATAQAMADAIPRAERLTLAGEDHGVLQRPEALQKPLLDFLLRV